MINRASILFLVFLLGSCARQTTPNGGPQDKTAPKLIRSVPEQNQKNFKGKTLTLTFDEAIKLKDPKDEIIIAPSPGKDITFTARQNRVIIELKNDLPDTTTYSMTFREGIQDITESNPAEDLKLAFSTGPVIDSLSIVGAVYDALTEKIPEKITVAIFSSDTFNILKHSASYFTRANKNGRFVISNLKAGSYKLYAFEDKNKNLKLETRSEKFGFVPGKIQLTKNTDSIRIALVALDSRPLLLTNLRNTQKVSVAKFNKSLVTYTAKAQGAGLQTSFGTDQTEVNFYHADPIADSIALSFRGLDSLSQEIDTLLYIKTGSGSLPADVFSPAVTDTKFTLEPPGFTAKITFNKPIRTISLDTAQLRLDSTTFISITPKDLYYDTIFKVIRISKPLEKRTFDSLKLPVIFYLGKSSFISLENDTSRAIQQPVTIPKTEEFAILFLDVQTQQSDFHIQLLTTDYKLVKESVNTNKITFRNIPPGEFRIRVFIDSNKNGKWDPGNITKDIPPEPTYYYKHTDGKYQFTLRAFWEVGPYTVRF